MNKQNVVHIYTQWNTLSNKKEWVIEILRYNTLMNFKNIIISERNKTQKISNIERFHLYEISKKKKKATV
jgi:hypothetical protein